MLYVIATPIGNLGDITLRALETLRTVDIVLAEDTRHTLNLLRHYAIDKPLWSLHAFNEAKKEEGLINELKAGRTFALVSDAGTPGISDPGQRLIHRMRQEGLPLTTIPGPCALIAALTLSGFATDRFQFIGFLPKERRELHHALFSMLDYPATSIAYDSPHRIKKTLAHLVEIAPEARIAIAREITKRYEELVAGSPSDLLSHFQDREVKGEIVLLTEPLPAQSAWSEMTPAEHVQHLIETFQLTPQEAIKIASSLRGIPKRSLYSLRPKHHP